MIRFIIVRKLAVAGTGVYVVCLKNYQYRAFCSAENPSRSINAVPKLYQYKICPFCNRVKSYMDYLNLAYEPVEVNPLTKKEISFSAEYKKVPIAEFEGYMLNGSDAIIDYLSNNYLSVEESKRLISEDTQYWMEWSEKQLAIVLYPNITRSFAESWETFAYASSIESWSSLDKALLRVSGPVGMLFANKKIKEKYQITDERKQLKDTLLHWTSQLKKPFLHGERLTLPDILVFGVMRSIEDFQTFRWAMGENAELRDWYEAVDRQIKVNKKQ